MKTLILYVMMLVLFSCSKDEGNNNHNVTIIGVGTDCGNSYLIKFDDNNINVPTNSSQNVFYEINLPLQYKVNGLRINVSFRIPANNEIMVCSAKDYSYPQIFIDKVNNE